MNIKNLLKKTARLLNISGGVIESGSTDAAELVKILASANNIIHEIAEEYIPFKKEEVVAVQDGVIDTTNLSLRCLEILSVKSDNIELKFELKDNCIIVDKKYLSVTVVYNYLPNEFGLADNIDLPLRLTERLLSYGIAAEYSLIAERYEESIKFDDIFMKGLEAAVRKHGEIRMPVRRWL